MIQSEHIDAALTMATMTFQRLSIEEKVAEEEQFNDSQAARALVHQLYSMARSAAQDGANPEAAVKASIGSAFDIGFRAGIEHIRSQQ